MTFTEAAVEVLRLVGKPLHYKKITEIAIERNLLSHVGKTPEVTMSSRLATMVKKDRGDAPIVKVKPGVFGLRDFDEAILKAAANETGHDYELPEGARAADVAADEIDDAAVASEAGVEVTAARKLPGADVFPEEDDDDEPILAKLDDDSDDQNSRRRRRRRRGDEGDGESEAGAGNAGPSNAGRATAGREPRDGGRGRDRDGGRGRDRDGGRGRDRDGGRGRDRDGGRGRDRDGGRGRDRDGGRGRERNREEVRFTREQWDRQPGDGELLGKELADAIGTVLEGAEEGLSFARIAEQLVRKGRLSGDAQALAPTVAAAVRGDIARQRVEGTRARFRLAGDRVELSDWGLSRDALRAESEVKRSASRQREQARRHFLRCIAEMPTAGFAELLATWLNAEGVVSLRAVRRPGSGGRDLHFAGVLRSAGGSTHLAIVVCRDGRDVGRERVIETRGALHHYGSASAAWLISTGQVMSGAREEAAIPGTAPCSLFDGEGLARAMERVGVGLTRHTVPLVALDTELLQSLGANAESVGAGKTERTERTERADRTERKPASREESADTETADEGGPGRRGRRRRRGRNERPEATLSADGGEAAANPDRGAADADADGEGSDDKYAPLDADAGPNGANEPADFPGSTDDEDGPSQGEDTGRQQAIYALGSDDDEQALDVAQAVAAYLDAAGEEEAGDDETADAAALSDSGSRGTDAAGGADDPVVDSFAEEDSVTAEAMTRVQGRETKESADIEDEPSAPSA